MMHQHVDLRKLAVCKVSACINKTVSKLEVENEVRLKGPVSHGTVVRSKESVIIDPSTRHVTRTCTKREARWPHELPFLCMGLCRTTDCFQA